MYIKRLKLVNFIGIKHGTGKDEIEINFPKKNKITMFNGGNGSGKSTIMSELHPYKETFDERKNLILDDVDGRKEIDIENNGDLYEIVHIYSKSSQSFIKKNGVELNENGGVKTCEDIITKELGIVKDYFKIGKIASNTKNFVQYTTSERKNYIANFLNIDDLLTKFDIVRRKNVELKKEIAAISNELKTFEPEDSIENKIQVLSSHRVIVDDELSEQYKKYGQLDGLMKRDKEELDTHDYEAEKKSYICKITEKNNNAQIIENFEHKYGILDDIATAYEKNTAEYNALSSKTQVNLSSIMDKHSLLNDYKNNKQKIVLELSAIGDSEDLEKNKTELAEAKLELEKLKSKMKNNEIAHLVNDMKNSGKDINKYLSKFNDFFDFIERYFNNLREEDLMNKSNLEMFMTDDFSSSISRSLKLSAETIQGKEELLTEKQKEKAGEETYISQLDNLQKRPVDCHIDSCPFIKDALCHKDVISVVKRIEGEISRLENDIKLLNTNHEKLQDINDLYKMYINAYTLVLPRENSIYNFFIRENSLVDIITGSLSEFSSDRQTMDMEVSTAISDREKYLNQLSKITHLTEVTKALEDSDFTLKEKYEKDISEFDANISRYTAEYDKLVSDGNKIALLLADKEKENIEYKKYYAAKTTSDSNDDAIARYKLAVDRYETVLAEYSASSATLEGIKSKITLLNEDKARTATDLNLLNISLDKIKSLSSKLENLNTEYTPISNVMDALSPTKGIPLIFIKVYLEETQQITNDLLDVAYNGDFEISFKTSAKDFFIEVRAKDNIKPDIKIASQGEVALTTISISLALIEQSIGNYNILCLDEIDGTLDSANRENFISILDSQIDKLGIEQVFVISHNDAFDNCDMDMVLLDRNSINKDDEVYMKNKNIIFDVTE